MRHEYKVIVERYSNFGLHPFTVLVYLSGRGTLLIRSGPKLSALLREAANFISEMEEK